MQKVSEAVSPNRLLRKSSRGPKTYSCQQLDRRVFKYVTETQSEGMSITRAVIQLTALEVIMQVNPLVDADFL